MQPQYGPQRQVVDVYLALAPVPGQSAWAWALVLSWRDHEKVVSGSGVGDDASLLGWAAEQAAQLLKRPCQLRIITQAIGVATGELPVTVSGQELAWVLGAPGQPLAERARAEAEATAAVLAPAWRIFQDAPFTPAPRPAAEPTPAFNPAQPERL